MKPNSIFKGPMAREYKDRYEKKLPVIWDNYKDKHCVVCYFIKKDDKTNVILIKTKYKGIYYMILRRFKKENLSFVYRKENSRLIQLYYNNGLDVKYLDKKEFENFKAMILVEDI